MSQFYCEECGDMLDDPDESYCTICQLIEDAYCQECGNPIEPGESCGICQELLDEADGFVLDPDDEEFLRGPFR